MGLLHDSWVIAIKRTGAPPFISSRCAMRKHDEVVTPVPILLDDDDLEGKQHIDPTTISKGQHRRPPRSSAGTAAYFVDAGEQITVVSTAN